MNTMINVEQADGKLLISYFNDQGRISIDRIPLTDQMMYNYYDSNMPEQRSPYTSFAEYPLKRLRAKRLSKFRVMEILYQYWKTGVGKKWHTIRYPKKHFIDIETEILTSAIPSASNPQEKVRTIAVAHQDHIIIYGSKYLAPNQIENIERKINEHFHGIVKSNTKYTFEHKYIETEKAMIGDFMLSTKQMSLISGWNVLKFDWSYLTARYKHLGGDPNIASPTGTSYGFYIADKWKKTEGVTVNIPNHLPIVDYMGLYEKLDTSISPKESSTLDWVSHEVLKVRKVKYNGGLEQLFANNYEDYCFYNAIDAMLVKLIDDKLQTFNTLQALAIAGRVQLHEGYFFSDIIENLFVCEYLERKRYFPEKRYNRVKEDYKGGFVLEPDKGVHEWVMGYDAESMYPSGVLAFNLGMDTYLGTIDKDTGHLNGQPYIFDPEKHIKAATGAIFTKDHVSVPRTVLISNIKERLMHKKEASNIMVELSFLEKIKDQLKKVA